MLYDIYESNRALLSPVADIALACARLFHQPWLALNPANQRLAAGLGVFHRIAKEYKKPEFGIRSVNVDGVEVAIQEREVLRKPFCKLLRFKRFTDDLETLRLMKSQPAVLVVAPLSGHHATLLRDTVRSLLQDHKVYITDWVDARMVPLSDGDFHLNDYVSYVQDFIRHIGPEVHVISVCQPTVPVLAAISLMATHGEVTPRSMTMMGGPIDARLSPTAVNNLATNKSVAWFENNVIHRVPPMYPGEGRAVYPGFLQHTGFVAMNPDRHLKSHYEYFLDLVRGDDDSAEVHRHFYDEYNAVLDMPAEYYLETIKTVFQDFALVNGTWNVRGTQVRPQDISTTALLTVEGELDDISGSGQTAAAHTLCTGIPQALREHIEVLGAGHYGIFSGRRWREIVYLRVRDFIYRQERAHVRAQESVTVPATEMVMESMPEFVQPSTDAEQLTVQAADAVTAEAAPLQTSPEQEPGAGLATASAAQGEQDVATEPISAAAAVAEPAADPASTSHPVTAAEKPVEPVAKPAPAAKKTRGRRAIA